MMFFNTLAVLLLLSQSATATETTTHVITSTVAPSVASTLGALYRQARSQSDQYYASRYSNDNTPQTSGIVGVRSDAIEHRDAAYYEARCLTCDPNKSATADRGNYNYRSRQRPRYDYYEDDPEDRRYRHRYDYYDRARTQNTDYDRYDPYQRNDLLRPLYYNDRYDSQSDRYGYYDRSVERPQERPYYERPVERPYYDRTYDRGNGYDNLDTRYDDRYDRYNVRRPSEDPYDYKYDKYYRYYMSRYDRNDPYERTGSRRPYDDRYDRYAGRDPMNSRGYSSSGTWSPGYDRGYASAWNYSGSRDNWRDSNRDRDRDRDRERDGFYRPRDYFYDSTAAPGGSRGTSYLYDRPESSTKPDSSDRDKPTSSPLTQDNKNYKD